VIGERTSVLKLMEAVDSYIPQPKRDVEKPFIMPVEDVFLDLGARARWPRGRIERGKVKVGGRGGDRGDQADAEDGG